MESEDAVWAETTGGGLLHQLFGYYPTLHDARVESLAFEGSTLKMDVDYTDSGAEGEKDLRVRMQLVWSGLREVDLTAYDSDLTGMTFHRQHDLLRTVFEHGFGISGSIVSEGFEAKLEKVDPPDRLNEDRGLRILYR